MIYFRHAFNQTDPFFIMATYVHPLGAPSAHTLIIKWEFASWIPPQVFSISHFLSLPTKRINSNPKAQSSASGRLVTTSFFPGPSDSRPSMATFQYGSSEKTSNATWTKKSQSNVLRAYLEPNFWTDGGAGKKYFNRWAPSMESGSPLTWGTQLRKHQPFAARSLI